MPDTDPKPETPDEPDPQPTGDEITDSDGKVLDPEGLLKQYRGKTRDNESLRAKAKEAAKEAADLREKLAAINTQNMSDQEKAIAEARKEGAAETQAEYEGKLTASRLKAAAAAAGFVDPSDVARMIDTAGLDSDEDIDTAIAELAKSKPYLLGKGAPPNGDQGPKGDLPADKPKGQSPNEILARYGSG